MQEIVLWMRVMVLTLPLWLGAFEIQGHRGMRGIFPENTLIGFQRAIEQGVPVVEMDVLLNRENEVMIMHDFAINPSLYTSLDGKPIEKTLLIKDLTLSELKNMDCGRLPHARFPQQELVPGTTIPTLPELLSMLNGLTSSYAHTCRLNIELKADPAFPESIPSLFIVAQKVIATVQQSRFRDRVYYSSFDFALLQEVRKIDRDATIALLCEEENLAFYGISSEDWIGNILKKAKELRATVISPHYQLVTLDVVRLVHDEGFRIIPWTVNEPSIALDLARIGVDGIITDYPVAMTKLFF